MDKIDFKFRSKTSRIDWKKIASIDVNKIICQSDIVTLQENIDHLTFCNIENELGLSAEESNCAKLYRIMQLIVEYLMHSQEYLEEYVRDQDIKLEQLKRNNDNSIKTIEKLNKDMAELKKEMAKRKKLIKTQQTLISANNSNYNQCAYCNKVFLNMSFLQAHISRRHYDEHRKDDTLSKKNEEIELLKKQVDLLQDKLNVGLAKLTEKEKERELVEKLAPKRLSSQENQENAFSKDQVKSLFESWKNEQQQLQLSEINNVKKSFAQKMKELKEKNLVFENTIRELQGKLTKQSNVEWIKDDAEAYKEIHDSYQKEIASYKKQMEELQHEMARMNESIKNRPPPPVAETSAIHQLADNLAHKPEPKQQTESYLREPPPITPRQINNAPLQQREPEPEIPKPAKNNNITIYLEKYCPLTLAQVKKDKSHLVKFKSLALKQFNEEMREIGIDSNETSISNADYKITRDSLNQTRENIQNDLPMFDKYRKIFDDLANNYALAKLNEGGGGSGLKPGGGHNVNGNSNRVKFKNEDQRNRIADVIINARPSQSQRKTSDENNLYTSADSYSDMINKNYQPQKIENNNKRHQDVPNQVQTRPDNQRVRRDQEVRNSLDNYSDYRNTENDDPNNFASQGGESLTKDEDSESFSSVTQFDNESKQAKQKSSHKNSSLHDSNSSSMWVMDTNNSGHDQPMVYNDRPLTANSRQSSNFESDDYDENYNSK